MIFNLDEALRDTDEYRDAFQQEMSNGQGSGEIWPVPEPLPEGLLAVPKLPEKLIPDPFRKWLCDIADRMQCPLEFPTIGAIIAIASLIGRLVFMRPKRYDDWIVAPNLWGVVIGRPGILKTPALTEAMKPLRRLEIQARERYAKALEEWEFSKLVRKAREDDLERKIKEAVKNERDPKAVLLNRETEQEEEPVAVRYIVNDSTVEKLGVILNQNPRGLMVFRDELTGWLKTLDREGHENDRAFYLESWNGTGDYTYDRISRGTLHIPAVCISLLGGIQPGPLAAYLRAAVRGEGGDDGLMQRLQLAVYPNDLGKWKNVDRWPDTEAKNRAFTIFEQLATVDPLTLGACLFEGESIPCLRFASDAQDFFDSWRTDLERKVREQDHPVLEAHLAKYRSLMPSLAEQFHLIEVVDGCTPSGPVSLRSAQLAAAWCDFLEAHVRRIYQGVTQYALFAAKRLADRIRASALPSPFTLSVVLRKGWAELSTLEEVRDAAAILEDLHWLRSEQIPSGHKGGRPRFHYHINPQLPKEDHK